MLRVLKVLYLVGLVSWVTYVIFCPTWIGHQYSRDTYRPEVIHEQGVFDLEGGGYEVEAPLWKPPRPTPGAASNSMNAPVRWPGQPIQQMAHVELAFKMTALRLFSGVIVLGVVLCIGAGLISRGQQDGLVSLAGCLSLCLVIAWFCIFVIAMLEFLCDISYSVSDGLVIVVFVLGVVGGWVYHRRRLGRGRLRQASV